MIYSDIFKIYPHKEDKPVEKGDEDLIQAEEESLRMDAVDELEGVVDISEQEN